MTIDNFQVTFLWGTMSDKDSADAIKADVEVPTHASKSASTGLTLKVAGQKFQLPIQASTFIGMLAVGYQAFVGFHEVQNQVARTADNVVMMSSKLDDVVEHVDKQDDLIKTQSDKIEELEEHVEELETCIKVPERCRL